MDTPGRLITLEGLDGCGKSTQLALLADYLLGRGTAVTATREPGGTALGQKIREILLSVTDEPITPLTELTLMFAARSQHIEQVIQPALDRGEVVLCDRFTDSSVAYQGYGRGVSLETIRTLENLLCHGVRPQLTLMLDLSAGLSMERTGSRNRQAREQGTRFEREGERFFERVREGFLAIARQEPKRIRIIDASKSIGEVQSAIQTAVEELLRSSTVARESASGGGRGI